MTGNLLPDDLLPLDRPVAPADIAGDSLAKLTLIRKAVCEVLESSRTA